MIHLAAVLVIGVVIAAGRRCPDLEENSLSFFMSVLCQFPLGK